MIVRLSGHPLVQDSLNDARDEQEPAPTGHWKTTSSYDIYMVDTPKNGDSEQAAEADSLKK